MLWACSPYCARGVRARDFSYSYSVYFSVSTIELVPARIPYRYCYGGETVYSIKTISYYRRRCGCRACAEIIEKSITAHAIMITRRFFKLHRTIRLLYNSATHDCSKRFLFLFAYFFSLFNFDCERSRSTAHRKSAASRNTTIYNDNIQKTFK